MKAHKISLLGNCIIVAALLMIGAVRASGGGKSDLLLRQLILNDLQKTPESVRSQVLSSRILLQPPALEQKSVFKAILFSLALPGMGELYAGGFESGKYFLIAESGLWLTFTSFELYGHWLEDDARRFAATHASASIDGKSDQFFVNIGNFNNVYEYNEKKLRGRDLASVYDPNGPFFWQWDNEQSRMRFRDLRVKTDNVFNNVRFVVGAIIVNHIVSAINAARLAAERNKEVSGRGWQIQTGLLGSLVHPDGVVLTVVKTF